MTLAEMEQENPDVFKNPPITDLEFSLMMRRNKLQVELEMHPNRVDNTEEQDEEEE